MLTAKLTEHDMLVVSHEEPGIIHFKPGVPAGMPAIPGIDHAGCLRGDNNVFVTPDVNAHVEVMTTGQQQAIPKDLLPKFQDMQKTANMTDDRPEPSTKRAEHF